MTRLLLLAFALAGCAPHGLDPLPGTWALSKDGATAAYTFVADGTLTFDGYGADGSHAQLGGAWHADDTMLALALGEHPTVVVPYSIVGDELTIVDDPATVRVGTHVDVVYTRQGGAQ
jgi:hypothetical protein